MKKLKVSKLVNKEYRGSGIMTPHGELPVVIKHGAETKYISNGSHHTVYTWKHGNDVIYVGKTSMPLNLRTSNAIYAINNDGHEGNRRKMYFSEMEKETFDKGEIVVEAHSIYFNEETAAEVETYFIKKYIKMGMCVTNTRV